MLRATRRWRQRRWRANWPGRRRLQPSQHILRPIVMSCRAAASGVCRAAARPQQRRAPAARSAAVAPPRRRVSIWDCRLSCSPAAAHSQQAHCGRPPRRPSPCGARQPPAATPCRRACRRWSRPSRRCQTPWRCAAAAAAAATLLLIAPHRSWSPCWLHFKLHYSQRQQIPKERTLRCRCAMPVPLHPIFSAAALQAAAVLRQQAGAVPCGAAHRGEQGQGLRVAGAVSGGWVAFCPLQSGHFVLSS